MYVRILYSSHVQARHMLACMHICKLISRVWRQHPNPCIRSDSYTHTHIHTTAKSMRCTSLAPTSPTTPPRRATAVVASPSQLPDLTAAPHRSSSTLLTTLSLTPRYASMCVCVCACVFAIRVLLDSQVCLYACVRVCACGWVCKQGLH